MATLKGAASFQGGEGRGSECPCPKRNPAQCNSPSRIFEKFTVAQSSKTTQLINLQQLYTVCSIRCAFGAPEQGLECFHIFEYKVEPFELPWAYSLHDTQIRSAIGKLGNFSLKDVRLIRDKATNTSRGFCFVELNTLDVSLWWYLRMYACVLSHYYAVLWCCRKQSS